MANRLIKIGVFYDGNYFLHVSNYYYYEHARRSRISISGLHDFIRGKVSKSEDQDVALVQVVDAHYFRGRQSATDARQTNKLYPERVFEDILMSEGVITHYLPLRRRQGKYQEKGIDVWLALEALELTFYKKFDVVVLIASDGDYIPLIRKLNSQGTKVMVLGWDFEYTTADGIPMVTKTSKELLQEVSFPIEMNKIINTKRKKPDPIINNLFAKHQKIKAPAKPVKKYKGAIMSTKNGFGFISKPPNNLFFHYSDVVDGDFNDLKKGDKVKYSLAKNEKGQTVAKNVLKIEE